MTLGAAAAAPGALWAGTAQAEGAVVKSERAFGYKRSVSHWTVTDLDWEELCGWLAAEGIEAVDLVGPENWHHLKKHGLDSSMCNGAELNLVDGFIHAEFEGVLHERYREMIPRVAKAGYTNLICFSGNRRGLSEEAGMEQAVQSLTADGQAGRGARGGVADGAVQQHRRSPGLYGGQQPMGCGAGQEIGQSFL